MFNKGKGREGKGREEKGGEGWEMPVFGLGNRTCGSEVMCFYSVLDMPL